MGFNEYIGFFQFETHEDVLCFIGSVFSHGNDVGTLMLIFTIMCVSKTNKTYIT